MAVITGSDSSDLLNGTDSADWVDAGSGDDTIFGGSGNDSVVGGSGDDTIDGGDDVDQASYAGNRSEYAVSYDAANGLTLVSDLQAARDGADWVIAVELFVFSDGIWAVDDFAAGRDHPTGGDDSVQGTAGDDSLSGGYGNDTLVGDGGADTLDGGPGDDQLFSDAYTPGFGDPYQGTSPDVLAEPDSLVGGAGDDFLFAGYGDAVDGGASQAFGDRLYISFLAAPEGVQADFREIQAGGSLVIGAAVLRDVEWVEYLEGSEYDDLLVPIGGAYGTLGPVYGRGGNDQVIAAYDSGSVFGGDGNDLLDMRLAAHGTDAHGDAGNDTILAGTDLDTLYGGEGNDSLVGSDHSHLYGEAGNDTLVGGFSEGLLDGGDGNDLIASGPGSDSIDAGAGQDRVVYAKDFSHYEFRYDDEANLMLVSEPGYFGTPTDTVSGAEVFQFADGEKTAVEALLVEGSSGDDTLAGHAWPDALAGLIGDDSLSGLGASDTLLGGAGDDTLDGGAGSDWAWFSHATGPVAASLADGTATGEGNDSLLGIENLRGGDGNDTLAGDWAANSLAGAKGNDLLSGGAGDDTAVFAGDRAEYAISRDGVPGAYVVVDLVGNRDGTDHVNGIEFLQFADGTVRAAQLFAQLGTAAGESLQGSALDDWIEGLAGRDTLDGGAGNDVLTGGPGNDSLVGGPGSDTASYAGSAAGVELDLTVTGGQPTPEGADTLVTIENLIGSGYADTLVGDAGPNELDGGAGSDVLVGAAGGDTLSGGDGADRLYSHTGTLDPGYPYATASFDTIAEADVLLGGAGDDTLYAGYGDFVDGGPSADGNRLYISFLAAPAGVQADFRQVAVDGELVVGGASIQRVQYVDYLEGSNYDDLLAPISGYYPAYGPVYGRGGNDHIVADYYSGPIYGGEGNDLIDATVAQYGPALLGEAGNDTIHAGGSAGTVDGGDGNDSLLGQAAADTLLGGAGNDTLQGGGGGDSIDGGDGTDTAVFAGDVGGFSIVYSGGTGLFTISDTLSGVEGTDTVANVEFFRFGDTTIAASGFFTIRGTTGNDSLSGTAGQNILLGLAGNDRLSGGAGNDTLAGGPGNDTLDGGSDTDTASYEDATAAVKVSLAVTAGQKTGGGGIDTLVSIENLVGGAGSDTLTGNAAANRLEGRAGNDSLIGGAGADTMLGGAGNDLYVVDNAGDVVVEDDGAGIDTVSSSVTFGLADGVDNLTLTGNQAVSGTGNALANILGGNGAANYLSGAGGDDELHGAAGNDLLDGGDGNDLLDGGAGADRMYGGAGDDRYLVDSAQDVVSDTSGTDSVTSTMTYSLGTDIENLALGGTSAISGTGNASANLLLGNSGANTLSGLGGNDTLDGMGGNDVLAGGAGFDVFRFDTAFARNIDRITDFNVTEDTIWLDNAIFTRLADGPLQAPEFQSGPTSVAATSLVHIIFNTATGALLYDPDGSGRAAAVQFATISLVGLSGTLTVDDFVVT